MSEWRGVLHVKLTDRKLNENPMTKHFNAIKDLQTDRKGKQNRL